MNEPKPEWPRRCGSKSKIYSARGEGRQRLHFREPSGLPGPLQWGEKWAQAGASPGTPLWEWLVPPTPTPRLQPPGQGQVSGGGEGGACGRGTSARRGAPPGRPPPPSPPTPHPGAGLAGRGRAARQAAGGTEGAGVSAIDRLGRCREAFRPASQRVPAGRRSGLPPPPHPPLPGGDQGLARGACTACGLCLRAEIGIPLLTPPPSHRGWHHLPWRETVYSRQVPTPARLDRCVGPAAAGHGVCALCIQKVPEVSQPSLCAAPITALISIAAA